MFLLKSFLSSSVVCPKRETSELGTRRVRTVRGQKGVSSGVPEKGEGRVSTVKVQTGASQERRGRKDVFHRQKDRRRKEVRGFCPCVL